MNIFETIVTKGQYKLKKWLYRELKTMGYQPQSKDGFIYAAGDIPIMLIAHMDTVHREQCKIIYYSQDKTRATAVEGIGGDDRCGIYMILQVAKKHHCHILFTEDEEKGCIGASKFVDWAKDNLPQDIKFNYLIEFDRRGANDAVFYDCNNQEFTAFVLGYGFNEEWGSFSDISIIAPALGAAAVNLSCGYYNAHTTNEYIVIPEMKAQIERACHMIADSDNTFYEYIENFDYRGWKGCGYWGENSFYSDELADEEEGEEFSTAYPDGFPSGHIKLMPLDTVAENGFYYLESDSEYWEFMPPEYTGDFAISAGGSLYLIYDDNSASLVSHNIELCGEDGMGITYIPDFADYFKLDYSCSPQKSESSGKEVK